MARGSVERAFVGLATVLSGDASAACRLDANEGVFRKKYPSFAFWPSDAQLALHLFGWVLGPGFNIPELRQALTSLTPDFARAAAVRVPERGHLALVTLNSANHRLLMNAHDVLECDFDPVPVYYPRWPHSLRP